MECDIPLSTLSTILKNRETLQAKHAIGSKTKKRYREPTDAGLLSGSSPSQSVGKAEELSKDHLRVQNQGLAPVGGFHGGRYGTTSSSGAFVVKMPLFMNRFVMTGSRENLFQSYAGMIQATSLMLMKRACIGVCFLTKRMP